MTCTLDLWNVTCTLDPATFTSVFSVIVIYSSPILTLNLTIEQDAMNKPLLIRRETEALEEFQSFLLFPSILE